MSLDDREEKEEELVELSSERAEVSLFVFLACVARSAVLLVICVVPVLFTVSYVALQTRKRSGIALSNDLAVLKKHKFKGPPCDCGTSKPHPARPRNFQKKCRKNPEVSAWSFLVP